MANFTYIGPALYANTRHFGNKAVLVLDKTITLINGREVEVSPSIKQDLELINESIYRILTTFKGERAYNRDFGCNLLTYVFEPADSIFIDTVLDDVRSSLNRWERRIVLHDVNMDQTGEHKWSVAILYSPIVNPTLLVNLTFNTR